MSGFSGQADLSERVRALSANRIEESMTMESAQSNDNFRSRLAAQVERMISVRSADPAEQRRGRLLAIFILILGFILIYTTIESALIAVIVRSVEYAGYVLQNLIVSIVVFIFWRVNRGGRTRTTAYVFFGFL
ncbi:MAG: hypothetical protein AB1750_12950, partial [Chloroflexota bacterium]